MRNTTVLLLLCAAAGTAHANGFVLNDHGADATGRANAVVATEIDGSAIVHNPGGVPVRDGINVMVGASLIFPSSSFECESVQCNGTTTDTESPMAVTPQMFVTARVHELVAVGIGFHTPFGSKIVWPQDAPTTDEILKQSLRTFFITPVVGVNLDRFVPGLTFGAGVDLVPATVELEQDIFFGSVMGHAHLGGDAFGVGFRAGAQYRPRMVRGLSVGLAYRSPVTLDFTGDGDFDIADPFRSQLPPDGEIKTSITLPQSVLIGAAYRPIPKLELELDGVWMGWSSFDKLEIELPDGSTTVSPRDYDDTLTIRAGAEYQAMPMLALRVGYVYDPTPVPDERLTPALPDIDRHVLTAGASYHLTSDYAAHFGAVYVLPGSNKTSDEDPFAPQYKGTYDVSALVLSLSLSGHFGHMGAPPPEPDPDVAVAEK
jgi:long-chain fatty acid transport protein